MKTIFWQKLPGNKYLKKLEPTMLTGSCIADQTIKLIGQNNQELVKVIYDREYIVSRLLNEIIQPLRTNSPSDFFNLIDLITEAWLKSEMQVYEGESYVTKK